MGRRRPTRPTTHLSASPAPGAGAAVEERLEQLYAQLPDLQCRGLCAHSCAKHVDASNAERARIAARGVDLDAPTPDGACPALSRTFGAGRCSVHDVRPAICRLWGVAAAMPCPHGCVPAGGHLSDVETLRHVVASLEVGGHRDAGVRDLLERCMADPVNAALMARFLRGDRSASSQLHERLLQRKP